MAARTSAYVLDGHALLAYLEGEVGEPRVKELLRSAEAGAHIIYLSLINLGEVLCITERENGLLMAQRVMAAIDRLPIRIVEGSRAIVLAAAHIKARYPISYAGAFAAATTAEHHGVLVTGDPEFRPLADDNLVTVEWLPRN